MKRTIKDLLAVGVVSLLAAAPASAITITATGTGPITAYFYGQSASYGSDIGLWVNNVFQGTYGLYNQTTAPGTSLVLGNATAGDTLVFELRVRQDGGAPPPSNYSLFTDPSLNPDTLEHAQSSAFAGGPFGIPAGVLIGFEDIVPLGQSDLDYNDHLFVFTGVTDRVPDGGMSAGLLAIGLMAVGLGRKLVK